METLYIGALFVTIGLLNAPFFELEHEENIREELAHLAVVMSRFRDQNVIGCELFLFSQKLELKSFPTPYRLSESSF